MSYSGLELDVSPEGIATVAMNRAPVNAQDREFREQFTALFDRLSADDAVRVVILTGAGKIFSAGADIKERGSISSEAGDYYRHNRLTRECFFSIMECNKPVIAAINGPAIGAGYALASCSDILIASTDAWIQMPELDRGLAGGIKFLQQHFSRSRSRLLFFTGRKIDAAELYRIGIIDELTSPEELMATARQIAGEIAEKSPIAVQKVKAAFNTVEEMPLRDGYRFEQTITVALSHTDDAREAREAFLEKRDPKFTGK